MKSELFIPYELAVIAKEKGFPNHTGSCLAAWEDNKKSRWLHFGSYPIGLLQAPLYQQIVDWFRDKHNLHICITPPDNIWKYIVYIKPFGFVDQNGGTGFRTYYEALNKAISEAFKLI